MAWKKQESRKGTYWQPTESGEQLSGMLIETKEGEYGMQYLISMEDGTEIWTPSHKVLQSRMDGITKGSKVKIEYTGQQPPKVRGENPIRMYDVSVWVE